MPLFCFMKRITALVTAVLLLIMIPVPAHGAGERLKAPVIKYIDWASGSKVSVRWTGVKGADGYQLYRSSTEDGKYRRVSVGKGSTNRRAIVKNKRKKIYYYKVRAYKVSKGKKKYGAFSDAVPNVVYSESSLGYLFPDGPPKSRKQMDKYLTKVKLPVKTSKGKQYIYLRVHKKLKKRIKACFKEMYDAGFRVRKSDTGSYNWRMMRTVRLRSHHSYGCVVDINWRANPMVKISQIGHCAYRPGKNRYSVTKEVVGIWKRHGFSWGGDWTEKKDYMHFTFTNN